jgi:E1A-binding protein p400
MKMRKEESLYAPRSLFDRPSPALAKMRRDMKLQRYRGIVRTPSTLPGLKPPAIAKPMPEPENVPQWVIHEDWALLQVIHLKEFHWPVNIKLTTGVVILHRSVHALHSAIPFTKYLAFLCNQR